MAVKFKTTTMQVHLFMLLLLFVVYQLQMAYVQAVIFNKYGTCVNEYPSCQKPLQCKKGGYCTTILDPSKRCRNEGYFCYRVFNETCDSIPEKQCANNLICIDGKCRENTQLYSMNKINKNKNLKKRRFGTKHNKRHMKPIYVFM